MALSPPQNELTIGFQMETNAASIAASTNYPIWNVNSWEWKP
jgi:hypothetical protein